MSYQVYFGDLTEENQALVLTLLKLKEEAGQLEPGEAELLFSMRGTSAPSSYPPLEDPDYRPTRQSGGRRSPRRGGSNGRSRPSDN